MIIITIPLKKEFIIDLFDHRTENNQTFIFKKQDQMKLYFEVNGDQQQAVQTVKKIIKNSSIGNALFYDVTYEK